MLVLLLSALAQRGVAAFPVAANATVTCLAEDNTSGQDSTSRSVVGIIWSCVTTIFACTWVAVHPNLPSEDDSDWAIYRRRARILIVALIVPEYIILWAANQSRSAKLAVQKLREFPACRNWTKTHGMFLVMGGFVLVDNSGKRLGVIQQNDLIKLLSNGQVTFPALSSSQIMDKSKGDAIAKLLVLFQTSWFMVQIVSRAIQHLPITELELTTLAFASLNILTCMLWWQKPLDVRHPILITLQGGKSVSESLPEMCFARQSLVTFDEVDITDAYGTERSQSQMDIHSVRSVHRDIFFRIFQSLSKGYERFQESILELREAELWESLNIVTGAFLRPWAFRRGVDSTVVNTALTTTFRSPPSASAISTHKRSSPNPRFLGSEPRNFDTPSSIGVAPMDTLSLEFVTRVPTFYGGPPMIYYHGVGSSYPIALEMFIGAVFGAIHCVAWTFQFPSTVEKVLWRSTSLYITCSPIALCALWLLISLLHQPITFQGSLRNYPIRSFISLKIVSPLVTWIQPFRFIFVMYIISRVTIFILAFVLLRDLPSGALQEVEWTNFIPHV
ncbi:hypothetical protein GYMLUDRAFT_218308 [Collybiopsis luxurians FD-317 M1]|nr:hypothetical protein GYMLUDRAFT_218308 [Collybiopsis luxurians FD-317 M1]